jgi:PAS domain S-box-containing protein
MRQQLKKSNLKESDAKYLRTILDNSLDAIIIMEEDGLITEWNKQAEIIFGWTHDEAVGKKIFEIIPPQHRKRHYEDMQQFLEDGTGLVINKTRELSGLNKRGEIFPIELKILAQKQFDTHRFTVFIRDISVRKQTEEFKSLLAAIVQSSDDAIISKTLDGTINSWNKGAQALYGYTPDEIIGKNVRMLIPPELQAEEDYILGQLRQGITIDHYETVRMHKDGHRIDVSLNVSPIKDANGKVIGASKTARDITERKKAEIQLKTYTQALEHSNKELDDFAHIASHDLKEPLRGIHNYSRFLLEDNQGKLDDDSVHKLERLAYLSQRMELLVNDLLYYSRLGRQELAIQKTDMNEVIHDIESTLDLLIAENNAKIIIPKPLPTVTCDKIRMTEVFRNLITNAIKYNDKEQKIVEVGFLDKYKSSNSKIIRNVFYVKDNGRGIAEEFYEEIFKIFKRLQNAKKEDGTGVGLTFAKKIIERHGGQIWLESKINQGTTFYFTLGDEANGKRDKE